MYQLIATGGLRRLADGAWIPPSIENRDWVEAQAWIAAGNTPLPADPPPTGLPDAARYQAKLAAADTAIEKGTIADIKDALRQVVAALRERG
jgi:hypothetical protein